MKRKGICLTFQKRQLPHMAARLLMLVLLMMAANSLGAQNKRINLKLENATLSDALHALKKKSGYEFVYSESRISQEKKRISVKLENASLEEALGIVLYEVDYTYRIESQKVLIIPAKKQKTNPMPNKRVIIGHVADADKVSLIGVTIMLKGNPQYGTTTNEDGNFSIEVPNDTQNPTLVFSYVGMKTLEKAIAREEYVTVRLEPSVEEMKEVVISGYYNINKKSFTGAAKEISIEEIKSVSNTNLVKALSLLTPGMHLVDNNAAGSNPNALPEIIVRGTSSLSTDADVKPNQPLIILDGVEISMQDLYDLDLNEIERVSVLKDASATALYGERAANGVIVIVRKPVSNTKLRLSYNFDGQIDVPDLSTYDYLHAADKLEFERLSSLYDMRKAADLEEYSRKLLLINKGVDTDWLSKPLRTGFMHNHSVSISGRGNSVTYRVNANYRNTHGVMRDDLRDNIGMGAFLSYNLEDKLTVSYQMHFSYSNAKESPYGSFSQYVQMNPYDEPYAGDGTLIKRLSWDIVNPLGEAVCGNYSKTSSKSYQNSLNLRWNMLSNLYVTGLASITTTDGKSETFTSPESAVFDSYTDIARKGSLREAWNKSTQWEANAVLNYNLLFHNDYRLYLHLGGEIAKTNTQSSAYTGYGFYKSNLHSTGYAAAYPDYGHPDGSQELTTRMGIFGNLNFIAKDRYFVDGSIRRSGSSQFGANHRYVPFWSLGGGWNIHNEHFAKTEWLNMLRLRYSYGVTGNVSFAPYQAITTYQYSSNLFYGHGIGAVPLQMGNDDLTWQSTRSHNVGISGELLKGRINFTFDYYVRTSDDMLIDLTIPPSVGASTVKKNLGKMRNQGYEFDLSVLAIDAKDLKINLKVNGTHNKNKILHISNALQAWNDRNNATNSTAPLVLYREGESSSAIYAVRSLGIDPANGKEVFLDKDGNKTLTYSTDDKVVCGDENPKLEGALYPSVRYKGFSLYLTTSYRFGGQIYNQTRANKVENVNPRYNVDKRAFSERWKNVNDIVPYLNIGDGSYQSASRHTSRFIEDDNAFEITNIELAYDLKPEWLSRLGMKRLRLGVSLSEPFRFTTVKYERGTAYPYSRGIAFSISPTF